MQRAHSELFKRDERKIMFNFTGDLSGILSQNLSANLNKSQSVANSNSLNSSINFKFLKQNSQKKDKK